MSKMNNNKGRVSAMFIPCALILVLGFGVIGFFVGRKDKYTEIEDFEIPLAGPFDEDEETPEPSVEPSANPSPYKYGVRQYQHLVEP